MASRLTEEFRERTKRFAVQVIRLYASLPRDNEPARVCGRQMLRAGTSAAAHTREASRARSDQEFSSKLGGCTQEADESQLWLELLREECAIPPQYTEALEMEAGELIAIMTSMINRTKNRVVS